MSELESMATLVASKNKQVEELRKELERERNSHKKTMEENNSLRTERQELKKKIENPYNADTIKALMDAHEMIRKENAELHKRVDAAYAGVAMDASAKKHYLQAIIERLDGIKNSVEVVLKE